MKKYNIVRELGRAVLMFAAGMVGTMGCYPLVPAAFAAFHIERGASVPVMIAAAAGMVYFLPMTAIVKYAFILVVIGLGIRLYRWSNHSCEDWAAGIIAAMAVLIMDYAQNAFALTNPKVMLTGLLEAVFVFGITMCMHAVEGLPYRMGYRMHLVHDSDAVSPAPARRRQAEQLESLASAVNGLSDAFLAMSQPKDKLIADEIGILEQEITWKMCGSCDACAICWNENRMRLQGGIRALLHAVVNHTAREELLEMPYVDNCKRYENMVEEATQAFSRLELNHAWYLRLQENRYVIAQQLDAMAGLMEEWANTRVNLDKKYHGLMTDIAYETRERGLVAQDIHLYEENRRLYVEAFIACKWDGGIPVKQYLSAVEKAAKRPMRLGKDTKSVITKEGACICVYEDTRFYGLQGIASEKKNGSAVNGDNFSFFAMDDGNYHICLSDGMGSGNRAKRESEMVVDLMQKFIEAGFRKEIAIKLMNSAMVLQGENNIFSTLDYAVVDLYSGKMELIKIGGAATFIKRGTQVECLDEGSLPAGADVRMDIQSTKKQLQNGDFLVMITDGVIEYLHVRNPKETLGDIIGMIETDNAGVLAERILEQVLLRTGGYAMDDMTVLVTGIWEK